MTENEEFYKLTFSQREGRAPLPEPMRLEHVSKDCRHLVWLAVDNSIRLWCMKPVQRCWLLVCVV